MACERITAGVTRALVGERPIKAVLDPYNPTGFTTHVNFTTSRTDRWQTDARRCHVNWAILDSDWEAEFCRMAESHPRVRSYVKNHMTTAMVRMTRCTWSSRSRATAAKTPKRRKPLWRTTGCPG